MTQPSTAWALVIRALSLSMLLQAKWVLLPYIEDPETKWAL